LNWSNYVVPISKSKLIPLAVAMAFLSWGCNKEPVAPPKVGEAAPATPRNPLEITITPEIAKQIRIGEPTWQQVTGSFRVAGRVEADERRITRVSAPVGGRVAELLVQPGETVKKGQVLAVLRSPELSEAQSQLLKALTQQQYGQRAVGRAQQLLDAGVIGAAELQRRQTELTQTNGEISGFQDHLRLLGMTDQAIKAVETSRILNAQISVLANEEGTVMDRKVTPGQIVQSAEILFILADLSSVWITADVPEQASSSLAVGKIAEAELAAFPDKLIRGRISFVSALVNPETRTIQARMDVGNTDRRYKPAMLATMLLKESAKAQRVVPGTALVREDDKDFVLVEVKPGTFALRAVTIEGEFDTSRILSGGLREGEKIILDGAFHVNNERKRNALLGSQ
jgi:cobalt-zinc-cadmium efflux system membrane fusion protein